MFLKSSLFLFNFVFFNIINETYFPTLLLGEQKTIFNNVNKTNICFLSFGINSPKTSSASPRESEEGDELWFGKPQGELTW